jgi:hypothetical protein
METVHVGGTNMEQLSKLSKCVAEDPKGSKFTATTEIDAGRKYVELVQKFSISMLTLVHFKCTYLLLFSLARRS